MKFALENSHIGVIGLGYVGMPLALMLSRHVKTTGFDVSKRRVSELKEGYDSNREIRQGDLRTTNCNFTNCSDDLKFCNVFIVTVPTPIDKQNKPDLTAVESASKTIAPYLKKGDIVVYESTVYPGVTEDVCGPLLEKGSGLICGEDFTLGYSPERINPGDAEHTVQNITKVVSAQTPETTDFLAELYGRVNGGNIYKAKDIRTAEASKVIENAQRDINVAFVNEIAVILDKLNISTYDVLEAAGTKWNFLRFTPGLVGGHCIGVDPYYLAHCAQKLGHQPDVILAGRKTNDSMGEFVAKSIHKRIVVASKNQTKPRVLLLGFTFKENINDIRNTRVIDIYNHLKSLGYSIDIHDPHAHPESVESNYGITLLKALPVGGQYDGLALLVGHSTYKDMSYEQISAMLADNGVIYDLKGIWREHRFKDKKRYYSL